MANQKKSKKKTSSRTKTCANARGSSKNMRRDIEIEDTARRELKADARDRRDYSKSRDNDPAWYAHNPQLLRDYASYPFGMPVGMPLELNHPFDGSVSNAVPGVAAYYFSPAVGYAADSTSPINIAARNIYSFVRHANSGHSNYDAPDLMLYIVAMDSIYMYIESLKRLLGVVLDYTPVNRYYPATLIRAMGYDPDDIAAHTQDLRGYINVLVTKVGSMCIPNSMSFMARHSWMAQGLYTDSSASKAQTYLYVPMAFYKYGLDTDGAGQLTLEPLITAQYLYTGYRNAGKKFSDIQQFAESLIAPILGSEDMNIMSGDILKAFGVDGVVKLAGVTEGYMVLPTYSQEVLSQIENASILNGSLAMNISQNKEINGGYLTNTFSNTATVPYYFDVSIMDPSRSSFSTGSKVAASLVQRTVGAIGGKKLLNFHHDNVTPEDVMVATRLTCSLPTQSFTALTVLSGISVLGTNNAILCSNGPRNFGTEVVNYAAMFTMYKGAYSTGVVEYGLRCTPFATSLGILDASTPSETSPSDRLLPILSKLAQFDWHPGVYPVQISYTSAAGSGTTYFPTYIGDNLPFQDIDNFTIIDEQNIYNMTQAAVLSEFSVPQMGAFANK